MRDEEGVNWGVLPKRAAGPSMPGCLVFQLKSGVWIMEADFSDLYLLIISLNHYIMRVK